MQVKAYLNNLRIAPRKVRLVANLVKGMKIEPALDQLRFLNRKSAMPLIKLINSAAANAEHNFKIAKDNLRIAEFHVNQGVAIKRYMPRAFGRASTILKKISKVTLILEEIVPSTKGEKAKEVSSKSMAEKVEKKEAAKKPAAKKSAAKK